MQRVRRAELLQNGGGGGCDVKLSELQYYSSYGH